MIQAQPLHPSALPTIILIQSLAHPLSIPQPLLDSLLHLGLTTIYEQQFPPSLRQWLARIECMQPQQAGMKFAGEVEETMMNLKRAGLDGLTGWLNELKPLCPWSDEDESNLTTTPLHRTSPLALYVRRFRMVFSKLSFDETVAWWEDVVAWSEGRLDRRDGRSERRKVADSYANARAAQDYQAMKDAAAFYDLENGTTSGKPQYALLNAAFLEFEAGGWGAAREALQEAIHTARNASDARCLAVASSLQRRLDVVAPPSASDSTAAVLGEGGGRITPTDLLWEVKRSYAEGAPLPSHCPTLLAALALFPHPPSSSSASPSGSSSTSAKGRLATWSDPAFEASYHAVSSILWKGLGSPTLAETRGKCAEEAVEEPGAGSGWSERLAVLARKTAQMAKENRAEEALAILLRAVDSRSKRRGIGVVELKGWEGAVWGVVRVWATMRDNAETLNMLKRFDSGSPLHWTAPSPLPPAGPDSNAEEQISESMEAVSALYNQALSLLDQNQPLAALSPSLLALHLSTSHSYVPLRVRSVILLALVRASLSPTRAEADKGLQEVEAVWGEVLQGEKECRAWGEEARGRLGVARAEGEDHDMLEAMNSLGRALDLYRSLSLHRPAQRVRELMASLCDHLSLSPSPLPVPPALSNSLVLGAELASTTFSSGDNSGDTRVKSWEELRNAFAQQYLDAEGERRKQVSLLSPALLEVINGLRHAVGVRLIAVEEG